MSRKHLIALALGAALTQTVWAESAMPASVDEGNTTQYSDELSLEQQHAGASTAVAPVVNSGATASQAGTHTIGNFTVAVPDPINVDDSNPSGPR